MRNIGNALSGTFGLQAWLQPMLPGGTHRSLYRGIYHRAVFAKIFSAADQATPKAL